MSSAWSSGELHRTLAAIRGARLERLGEATAAHRDLDPQCRELARPIGVEQCTDGLRLARVLDVAVGAGASPRPIAECVEQRLELAGTTAPRRELAILEQNIGRARAIACGEPVPHDFADARDLIHRAERAVVAGLPREPRALRDGRRTCDELGRCRRQALLGRGIELREDVDAHHLVKHDATVADGIDELAREQAGERGLRVDTRCERGNGRGRDCLAQDRECLERRARRGVERC